MTKRNALLWAILVCAVTYCTTPPASIAQDPIRVETNEVLVPALVGDKERLQELQKNPTNLFMAALAGKADLAESIVDGIIIHDLTAADFRIFEDGKLQGIQNVAYQRSLYWDLHDNKGFHTEFIGSGGGKWSGHEWPAGQIGDFHPPYYLIAYAPPESPEGSCHKIRIEVNRRNALVLARGEYCNTKHLASDPLDGTPLGKQMESDLTSAKDGKLGFTLTAVPFFADGDAARVHIALDWPWKSLGHNPKTVGVLGMVFARDGTLRRRFSDGVDVGTSTKPDEIKGIFGDAHSSDVPTRYETQLILPPGGYQIQVVLSDGTKFGRAEMGLTVDRRDSNSLAISAISLCKQIDELPIKQSSAKLLGNWTDKSSRSYVPLVSNGIEFKATGNTNFKKGEILYVYFEVSEPLLGVEPSTTVEVQMRVVDLKTSEVKSDPQLIGATPYVKPGNPVIPIGRGINISALPNGSYRLDVRATDSTGRNTDWRSAKFTVE
jgi:hypothetical protein